MRRPRKQVTLYTDGACSGNPGPGGWGAILQYGGHEKVLSGGADETTNNRMELFAAIAGLSALNEPCRVALYSDSRYLVEAMQKRWPHAWRARGWKRKTGPALNPDLWESLLALADTHEIDWRWVKGHAETEGNNRCDALAHAEAQARKDKGESI